MLQGHLTNDKKSKRFRFRDIMKEGSLLVLFAILKVLNSLAGFEFKDNLSPKFVTKDNGVAEVFFQENIEIY